MAAVIMVSTFGCINSLVLAGPRAYYAMARDKLFFPAAGHLNRARVPGWSLAMQGTSAGLLVLLTTYSPATGYGNLYSDLLDYIISAALLFYILTIAAVVVLRYKRPDAERLYRTPGYPVVPAIYVLGASAVVLSLFIDRPATTWPGLVLVIAGLPVYWLIRRAGVNWNCFRWLRGLFRRLTLIKVSPVSQHPGLEKTKRDMGALRHRYVVTDDKGRNPER